MTVFDLRGDATGPSRFVDSYFLPRVDDPGPMFAATAEGAFVVKLEGYAVIPLDDYRQLTRPPRRRSVMESMRDFFVRGQEGGE
jgi:hypothetical protein